MYSDIQNRSHPSIHKTINGPVDCNPSAVLHASRSTDETSIISYTRRISYIKKWSVPPAGSIHTLNRGTYVVHVCDDKSPRASAWNSAFVVKGETWEPPPTNIKIHTVVSGHWAAFHSWFCNNYGHVLHDHASTIAGMRVMLPPETNFLLVETPLLRSILEIIDPEFTARRVKWLTKGEVVKVENGTLSIYINPGRHKPGREQRFMNALRHWLPRSGDLKRHILIYCSRSGKYTHHGRMMEEAHEADILAGIKRALVRYNRPEQILIYNGMDSDGNAMPIKSQRSLFREASIIIGPHGSAMANIIWAEEHNCSARPSVIEFICGIRSSQVQPAGCPWMRTYFYMYAGAPWIDYHHISFAANSTKDTTFINLNELDMALDAVLGRKMSEPRPIRMES